MIIMVTRDGHDPSVNIFSPGILPVCQGEVVCQKEMKAGRVKKEKGANWKDKIIGKKS